MRRVLRWRHGVGELSKRVSRWFTLGWWRTRTRRQRLVAGALAVVVLAGTLVGIFGFLLPGKAEAWWDTSYAFRRKVTFNNSASAVNLTNFPVRVSVTSTQIDYNNTQNSGQDIRFVDSDDSTVLSHEIERWDEAGRSELWVKIPQINSASTTDFIWMYYGNPGASDGQAVTSVWTNGYRMVHHFEETGSCTPTNAVTDSTANNNDGTCVGSPNPITTGKIGAARQFVVADNDYVSNNTVAADVANGSLTFSAWFNLTSAFSSANATDMNLITVGNSGTTAEADIYLDQADGKMHFGLTDSGGNDQDAASTFNSWPAGSWYHIAGTFNSGGLGNATIMYFNGAQNATNTNNSRHATDPTEARLAAYVGSSDRFGGTLDELRISNVNRTADWMEAEHISSNNAMNSFDAEESYLPPPTLNLPSNGATNVSATPTFELRGSDPANPNYLRYKIDVCSNSDCSSILRTIDQTSSQTGWTGQDAQTSTAYVASATLGSSTMASHIYQAPALTSGVTYYWRGYAIDPGGGNVFSAASSIQSFTVIQNTPAAPTLINPANAAATTVTPTFQLRTTDADNDYLRYKIDVCSVSDCSVIVRTIDQTASQVGWTGQDAQSATAYVGSSVIGGSTAATHIYQEPALTFNTQYWWRGYGIDPASTNTFSPASSIRTFTTSIPGAPTSVEIRGGTDVRGGTTLH